MAIGFQFMKKFGLILSGLQLLACPAVAEEASTIQSRFRLGDCVMFREGGAGQVLKSPTYWLRGTVVGMFPQRRLAGRCPQIGKPVSIYTRSDWARAVAAMPCFEDEAEAREVNVLRVRVAVEDWETPWSNQHGTVGWLFRGQFLDTYLKKNEQIDMDAAWLEACLPGS